jgi:NtrC-family two-component system response regulator AlgB
MEPHAASANAGAQLPLRVLIVDDEKNIRAALAVCLEGLGCLTSQAASDQEAITLLRSQPFDLAFLDLRLGRTSGLDLLPRLLGERPDLAVVLITAYATFDTAVEAIRRGARDYVPKPFTPAQIRHVVEKVGEQLALTQRLRDLEDRLGEVTPPEANLETRSPRMRAILDMVRRAAGSDAAVLLRGESGTGKGYIARALHAQSGRAGRPFVTVNCPTLSQELLAGELFGHARGAFTGAVRDQAGRVEVAEGGTLFLDEIGEISPALQAKLLRFLQDKEFERIGENRTRRANVRVLAATNRDLEKDVEAGRFREDLYYRLNVVDLQIPPLRDRREDILPLAGEFLAFFARQAGRAVPELSPAAQQALLNYSWPGNIRELRNALERAIILWPGDITEPQAFSERIATASSPGPFVGGQFTLDAVEREHIWRVVSQSPTLEDAARTLGIDASTLYRKRKRYEEADQERRPAQ